MFYGKEEDHKTQFGYEKGESSEESDAEEGSGDAEWFLAASASGGADYFGGGGGFHVVWDGREVPRLYP